MKILGWKSLSETMKLLPGPALEFNKSTQQAEEAQDISRLLLLFLNYLF